MRHRRYAASRLQRRVLVHVAAAAIACAVTLRSSAHELPELVVRTLTEQSDAVLVGTVVKVRKSPAGVWHTLEVERTLAGTSTAGRVYLFSHGARVPESVQLEVRQRVLIGTRWLSRDHGAFHARLLDDLARRVPESSGGGTAGLAARDGIVVLNGDGPQDDDSGIIAEVALLLAPSKSLAGDGATSGAPADLLELAASPSASVRSEAVRRLGSLARPELEAVSADVRDLFAAELGRHGDPGVLQAYVDLVRLHGVAGCEETLCRLILGRDEVVLIAEGMDALARSHAETAIAALLSRYPMADDRTRARLIRALGKLRWEGALHLAREALETAVPELHHAGVEALGELKSAAATDLLSEVLSNSEGELRRITLEALARQRTARAREVLLRARAELRPEERRWIRPMATGERPAAAAAAARSLNER